MNALSWKMFHVPLRRMCFLLLLDGMFCTYVRSVLSIVLVKSTVFLLIFGLNDLFTVEGRVLKSPIIVVLLCIFPFRSVNIFLYT